MTRALALFLIIFLEGYVVLSTELLAIRLMVPFTGSGTDTVSIIIAAVLLPLAFGYHAGGKFSTKTKSAKGSLSVRRRLLSNLVVSAFILTAGLSYVFLDFTFDLLQKNLGWYNRIWLATFYSLVFISYPVYLLGQTIPLVSNYFSREHLSLIAGRMLFFSTLGSFIGAIFSTLVLMSFLGVHHTASITIAAIALLVVLLAKKKNTIAVYATLFCLAAALALNSPFAMHRLNIVSNNKYSTVQIIDDAEMDMRTMMLNRSIASTVYRSAPDTYHDYTAYIEDNFLSSVFFDGPEKSILVLGAGGFTIGRRDQKNTYIYVDIDGALKDITEQDFLQEKLSPNKSFVAMDARAYLIQSKEKFDLIVLDLFRDPISVAENLCTVEFFEQVKGHLREGGAVVGNYWASPTFTDAYSRNLDHTLRAAFPYLSRQVIGTYDVWKENASWRNIIYSYVQRPAGAPRIYTDIKNQAAFDRPTDTRP